MALSGDVGNGCFLFTEGQTLTLTAGSAMNFHVGAPVYVDTLIKFTPCEDDPVIDDIYVKAAVFVNVDKNLVVFHGSDGLGTFMTDTGMNIDTSRWHRLTILLGTPPQSA
jgi:hypothetical protein